MRDHFRSSQVWYETLVECTACGITGSPLTPNTSGFARGVMTRVLRSVFTSFRYYDGGLKTYGILWIDGRNSVSPSRSGIPPLKDRSLNAGVL